MGKVIPGIAILAVVLADRAPLAFTQVGTPQPPRYVLVARLDQRASSAVSARAVLVSVDTVSSSIGAGVDARGLFEGSKVLDFLDALNDGNEVGVTFLAPSVVKQDLYRACEQRTMGMHAAFR
jgi:hypothetical protein